MALTDKLTAIADAIRAKTGKTDALTLDQMATTISTMETDSTNFEIVGGTTQPSSPKENTIWISTSTTIGEYQFSYMQPTTRVDGTSLQTGDVWIRTHNASASAFNAIKKNSVIVYPSSCLQWSGSAWVTKTAKIYQNGAWKITSIKIVDNGKAVIQFAGTNFFPADIYTGSIRKAPTVTQNSANYAISLKADTSDRHLGTAFLTEKIDFTNLSTISITFSSIVSTVEAATKIALTLSDINNNHTYALSGYVFLSNGQNNQTNVTYTLDVSGVSGEKYIGIFLNAREKLTTSISITDLTIF